MTQEINKAVAMNGIQITTEPDHEETGSPRSREVLQVNFEEMPKKFPPGPSSHRSSPPSVPSPPPTPSQQKPHSKLAKISDELLFESENQVKISGRIHIKNLTVPTSTIVFKIKTTNPGKFHVWPTIGLISDRASAVSKVTLKPSVSVESIKSDKFQVQVMIVPKELLDQIQALEEDDQYGNSDGGSDRQQRRSSLAGEPGHSVSTLAELNSHWKRIAEYPGVQCETHRVNIKVDSKLIILEDNNKPKARSSPLYNNTPVNELSSGMSGRGQPDKDSETLQFLERLEARLDSVDQTMNEQFMYLQWLLYALVGALVAFTGMHLGLSEILGYFSKVPVVGVLKQQVLGAIVGVNNNNFNNPNNFETAFQGLPPAPSPSPVTAPPPPPAPPTYLTVLPSTKTVTLQQRHFCPLFG